MEVLSKENQQQVVNIYRDSPLGGNGVDSSLISYEDEEKENHNGSLYPLKTRDVNIPPISDKSESVMKRKLSVQGSNDEEEEEEEEKVSKKLNFDNSPTLNVNNNSTTIMSPAADEEEEDQNLSTTGIMKPTTATSNNTTGTTTTTKTIASSTQELLSQAYQQMSKLQTMLNEAQNQIGGIEDECDRRIEYIAGQLHEQYSKKHATKVNALRNAYQTKWIKKVQILQDELAESKAANIQLQLDIQFERKEKSDLVSLWDQFVECEQRQQKE